MGEEWRSSSRGSRGWRGPFPKRPEGVRLARLFRAGSPRGFLGPAVVRGARRCEPWSCSVGPRSPCEGVRGVCLRSAAHVAEPLRALPGPACAGGDLTPVPGSAVVNGFCTPSRGLLAASRRSTSTLGGRLGRAGSMPQVRPQGLSQLVLSPGLVGPGSTIPPRAPRRVAPAGAIAWLRSCNPNARRDDFIWWAARPRDRAAGELLDPVVPAAGTRAMNQGS